MCVCEREKEWERGEYREEMTFTNCTIDKLIKIKLNLEVPILTKSTNTQPAQTFFCAPIRTSTLSLCLSHTHQIAEEASNGPA
jgi:hypothetical protein